MASSNFGERCQLVMLHGWGVRRGVWNAIASGLATEARVHAPDLRGYGEKAGCAPQTLDDLVAPLAAALPDGLTVCGWSLGGQVALRWAQSFPQQIKRIVLVATTPCFVRRDGWDGGVHGELLDGFAEDLASDVDAMLKRFAALQSRGDSRAASVMRQLGRCLAVPPHTTVQALAAGLAILRATDLREEAAGVTQPALIVHGANDAVAHPTAGAWLATALPRGRLTKYDAAGHAPFLSEPRRFVRDLAEFCRD